MSELNETDKKLIEITAKVWVDNGGDADGILFCLRELLNEIRKQRGEADENI